MAHSEQHREMFREEAREILAELESALLELEERPDNQEQIGCVFRAMHTIKGTGSMFGFEEIGKFTHELETVFDLIRNGKMKVTKELISLALAATDLIRAMLEAPEGGDPDHQKNAGQIISLLKSLTPVVENSRPAPVRPPAEELPEGTAKNVTYRMRFRPSQNIFKTGTNPAHLLQDLSSLGNCTMVVQTEAIPPVDALDPELCYTYWDITLTTDRGLNAIRDVFMFVEDESELKIEAIDIQEETSAASGSRGRIGDILLERGDVTPEQVREAAGKQKRIGELLVEAGAVDKSKVESALAEQEHLRQIREKKQREESVLSIRVPAAKLDRLVDLVGEIVTVQAQLSQTALARQDPVLHTVSEEIERLVSELRDHTMSIRMLPIGTIFSKLKRLVRDLSKELGKEIELVTEGAETELDKTVIERLNDPLVHLIRNCIDHGIEPPDVRENMGKPRNGVIILSAKQSTGHVLLSITDDGKGLDRNAIRTKAVEKGMVQKNAQITEQELFSLILAPGFSTATQVTNVSGRGVGMDVVRQAIDSLRGAISMESRSGEGTTITLKLPLTLAIIDGFLTQVGSDNYVFPLSSVEECIELKSADTRNMHGRNIANVRGEIVPYIRLRDQFFIAGSCPTIEQIVITRVEGNRVGFVVDQILGGHQTVIKNLGRCYRNAEGISGATILGNGTVALILDVSKLVDSVDQRMYAAATKKFGIDA